MLPRMSRVGRQRAATLRARAAWRTLQAPRGTPALSPVADAATVVFVRNSGVRSAINFTILDQDGDLLGDSVAESHFAVDLPAGQYFFVAKAENADVVRANLSVGRL